MTEPKKGRPVRDLETLEGLGDYLRGDIADAVNHALGHHGSVPRIGVVLAQRDGQKRKLDAVEPAIFGGIDVSIDHIEKVLRDNVPRLHGAGVLYIDPAEGGRRVRFALEHSEMGDHQWTARVEGKTLTEIEGPMPTPESAFTRFLPRRHMN